MSGKVAVTGGSGKLGRACIDALLEDGWTPFNFDLVPPRDRTCSFTRLDLTDYGQVVEALAGIDELHDGVDAVLHLAAIPGATHAGNAETFVNNITATFHVFQAAKLLRIHNLVWASSETLLGYPFNRPPAYVPLDEDVPRTPEVAYSLVKDLEEEMAVQFCRWDPEQKMIGLRFSNVMAEADYAEFPSFEFDPGVAQVEPVVLHRRPGRRPGGGQGARLRPAGLRGVHHRGRRHRDEHGRPPSSWPRLPRTSSSAPRCLARPRCAQSRRQGECSDGRRATTGAITSTPRSAPSMRRLSRCQMAKGRRGGRRQKRGWWWSIVIWVGPACRSASSASAR